MFYTHAQAHCCTTVSPKVFTNISAKASQVETLPRSTWLYVIKYTVIRAHFTGIHCWQENSGNM